MKNIALLFVYFDFILSIKCGIKRLKNLTEHHIRPSIISVTTKGSNKVEVSPN